MSRCYVYSSLPKDCLPRVGYEQWLLELNCVKGKQASKARPKRQGGRGEVSGSASNSSSLSRKWPKGFFSLKRMYGKNHLFNNINPFYQSTANDHQRLNGTLSLKPVLSLMYCEVRHHAEPQVEPTSIVVPPRAIHSEQRLPLCTTKQLGIYRGIYTKKRSKGPQTSISFFFWAALLAPSVKVSKSPLISHIPRKIPSSLERSSQGASYSITLPLSRTRTLS